MASLDRHSSFSERKRGYDTDEVDAWVEKMFVELDRLESLTSRAIERAEAAEAGASRAKQSAADTETRLAAAEARLAAGQSGDGGEATEDAPTRAAGMLALAQKTADAAVAEAEEFAKTTRTDAERFATTTVTEAEARAAELVADAQARADELRSEARASATKLVDDARTEADQLRAEQMGSLRIDISELEALRSSVNADVEALDAHLERERSRIAEILASVTAAIDEPSGLALGTGPALSEATLAPLVGDEEGSIPSSDEPSTPPSDEPSSPPSDEAVADEPGVPEAFTELHDDAEVAPGSDGVDQGEQNQSPESPESPESPADADSASTDTGSPQVEARDEVEGEQQPAVDPMVVEPAVEPSQETDPVVEVPEPDQVVVVPAPEVFEPDRHIDAPVLVDDDNAVDEPVPAPAAIEVPEPTAVEHGEPDQPEEGAQDEIWYAPPAPVGDARPPAANSPMTTVWEQTVAGEAERRAAMAESRDDSLDTEAVPLAQLFGDDDMELSESSERLPWVAGRDTAEESPLGLPDEAEDRAMRAFFDADETDGAERPRWNFRRR